MSIQIFATDRHGDRHKIDDLYFFEENMIHWFDDGGYEKYTFEIVVDGKMVWSNAKTNRVSELSQTES